MCSWPNKFPVWVFCPPFYLKTLVSLKRLPNRFQKRLQKRLSPLFKVVYLLFSCLRHMIGIHKYRCIWLTPLDTDYLQAVTCSEEIYLYIT